MLVRLDGAEKMYGGQVAAPVFKRIAERLFSYMAIPPTEPVPERGKTCILGQARAR